MSELSFASVGPAGLKVGKKNDAYQHFCSWGKCPASLVHALKFVNKSPSCLAQVIFKLLLLYWFLEQVMLSLGPLRAESRSPIGLWVFWS